MSEAANQDEAGATEPGAPEPARMRRGIFGYKRGDVDREFEARDALLAELRQDVAALWLAFAQHDRLIRMGLHADVEAAGGPPAPASPTPEHTAYAPLPEPSEDALAPAEGAESIGRQLSDLDEVLVAIEMATQTLERTYADEIATVPDEPPADEIATVPDEPAADPGEESDVAGDATESSESESERASGD